MLPASYKKFALMIGLLVVPGALTVFVGYKIYKGLRK